MILGADFVLSEAPFFLQAVEIQMQDLNNPNFYENDCVIPDQISANHSSDFVVKAFS